MSDGLEPDHVAARRLLGAELRKLRHQAGLTGQELAHALGWSQPKISRIEQGRTQSSVDDVQALLDALNAAADASQRVRELAERSAEGEWRNSTGVGLTRRQRDFIALESSATQILHYNPVLLPGYMQTEAYARHVIRMAGASNEENALESRLARRATMLSQKAPVYRVTLMETCLRWRPGTPMEMVVQLRALADFAELDNVTIRVVSLEQTQATFVQHPFMVFQYQEPAASQALVETTTQDYRLTDPAAIDRLMTYFERLSSSALSPSASLALIRRVARGLADAE